VRVMRCAHDASVGPVGPFRIAAVGGLITRRTHQITVEDGFGAIRGLNLAVRRTSHALSAWGSHRSYSRAAAHPRGMITAPC